MAKKKVLEVVLIELRNRTVMEVLCNQVRFDVGHGTTPTFKVIKERLEEFAENYGKTSPRKPSPRIEKTTDRFGITSYWLIPGYPETACEEPITEEMKYVIEKLMGKPLPIYVPNDKSYDYEWTKYPVPIEIHVFTMWEECDG